MNAKCGAKLGLAKRGFFLTAMRGLPVRVPMSSIATLHFKRLRHSQRGLALRETKWSIDPSLAN